MFRWFRRADEPGRYLAADLGIAGQVRGATIHVEVTNVDDQIAEEIRVVMLLNMPRTSERPRIERDIPRLVPFESAEFSVELDDPPVRGWWFATWLCCDADQRA